MAERAKITISGIVQGVGFRPYVYNLATSLDLKGCVANAPEGVLIDAEGAKLADFIERLAKEAPPLAQIIDVAVSPQPVQGYTDFSIIGSRDNGSSNPFTLISPDISICNDCLRELLDSDNRRYLYPFINCTNCGPRYTITKSVPYDRPHTTMAAFQMCRECSKEYDNPADRRFHAQPNACPACGPKVWLRPGSQELKARSRKVDNEEAIREAVNLLKSGKILAIKGLGGFHLACDATNNKAVARLREKRRRSNKPFALMAPDINTIRTFCELSDKEKELLLSNKRPIVLLRKRDAAESVLSKAVSPNNRHIGFMLPYTPLHYLLFYQSLTPNSGLLTPNFFVLVMTSGNISEEPIVKDNDEAIKKLSGIADAFLLHDRGIFMRVDDPVLRAPDIETMHNKPNTFFIRRSRGYAPEPIGLHTDGPEVMGCGADLKNTFTLTKGRFAIQSQHIGDMENFETLTFFEECFENMKAVYRVTPAAIAHDLHPNYLSAQWALRQNSIKRIAIQHHYAHIGSVMAEHGLDKRVIGVAFDGTGFGADGTLWGGEFLVADIEGFERAGHFKYIPLPGGESAIKEPWRMAVSYIVDAGGDRAFGLLEETGFLERYGREKMENLIRIVDKREFSPLSSGAGRLFDAVSALLGLCDRNTFEGEAAMSLEAIVLPGIDDNYPFDVQCDKCAVADLSSVITGIIEDLKKGVARPVIAAKFHNTVSGVILKIVETISSAYGLKDVALSGGTFQNMYLLKKTVEMLNAEGYNVFINNAVPCNDACISLGQAYIARERLKRGSL